MIRTMLMKALKLLAIVFVALPVSLVADETKTDGAAPVDSNAEPVTGAFGLTLGEHFDAALVAEVTGDEDKAYRGPGGAEIAGTLYRIAPKTPDSRFTTYSVATTKEGIIYAIRAEYASPDKTSRCDVPPKIAAAIEQQHGKPRGKGGSGDWYAFRDMSVAHYRGIRLYANRCDQGIYEIVYSDDGVRLSDDGGGHQSP